MLSKEKDEELNVKITFWIQPQTRNLSYKK